VNVTILNIIYYTIDQSLHDGDNILIIIDENQCQRRAYERLAGVNHCKKSQSSVWLNRWYVHRLHAEELKQI